MSKFALLFLVVFSLGIVMGLFYSGSAAFMTYQIVYFLNPDNRWWYSDIPGLRYSFIAATVMLAALIARHRQYWRASPWAKQPPFKWMAFLLIVYHVAYYTFALDPQTHGQFTFEFTKLVVIVFVAYKLIDSEKGFDACLWTYLVGAGYIGYLATTIGRNSGWRVEGIGMVDSPDANGTAAALVPAAALLIYFAWQGRAWVKLLAVVLAAYIINGLVLINSRGAFLGVLVSAGLFVLSMLVSRHQKKGQRLSAILVIVLGTAGALYLTDDTFWTRMDTIRSDDEKTSGASRITFWLTTFEMLEDHPFGLGIRGYNLLAPQYMDDETRGGVEHRSVHSLWFQGLSEVGWVGFSIFVSMLLSLFSFSRRAKTLLIDQGRYEIYFKVVALECALIGYLTAGTFIDQFRAVILYWMVLFVALAVKFYYLRAEPLQSAGIDGGRYVDGGKGQFGA
jgi:hypothetical protein